MDLLSFLTSELDPNFPVLKDSSFELELLLPTLFLNLLCDLSIRLLSILHIQKEDVPSNGLV